MTNATPFNENEFTDVGLHLEVTRLRAENRRLIEANDALRQTNGESTQAELQRLRLLVLNQQIQLTKLNTAMQRRNRRIKTLTKQNMRYRMWAAGSPIDADRSLMSETVRRVEAINRAKAKAKIIRASEIEGYRGADVD